MSEQATLPNRENNKTDGIVYNITSGRFEDDVTPVNKKIDELTDNNNYCKMNVRSISTPATFKNKFGGGIKRIENAYDIREVVREFERGDPAESNIVIKVFDEEITVKWSSGYENTLTIREPVNLDDNHIGTLRSQIIDEMSKIDKVVDVEESRYTNNRYVLKLRTDSYCDENRIEYHLNKVSGPLRSIRAEYDEWFDIEFETPEPKTRGFHTKNQYKSDEAVVYIREKE